MTDTASADDPFDRRGLGHNNPPEPSVLERVEELIPACDDWTSKGEITTEDEARLLTEFLEQLRKSREALRAGAMPDRQPHLDALAAIRATVAHLMEPHEKALEEIGARSITLLAKLDLAIERITGSKKVTGLLAAYIAKKRQRALDEAAARQREAEQAERAAERAKDRAAVSGTIDDELAAQQAVEAADAVARAAAKPVPRANVKGDLAAKATSLREYWSAKIVDWPAARRHYRQNARVKKAYDLAVEKVADDDARHLKDPSKAPPGVEFLKREQAQ